MRDYIDSDGQRVQLNPDDDDVKARVEAGQLHPVTEYGEADPEQPAGDGAADAAAEAGQVADAGTDIGNPVGDGTAGE